MRRFLYKLLDIFLTFIEGKLYDENYYEADSERTGLRLRVRELEDEIEFLKERDSYGNFR